MEYFRLARGFPGWDIVTIKNLPVREREFWLANVEYRREMEQWQQQTSPQAAPSPRYQRG